jgi:L-lysine 2,3-aminomutase
MSDDILSRLQGYVNGYLSPRYVLEAADEIEKLRYRIQHLESEVARLERLSHG